MNKFVILVFLCWETTALKLNQNYQVAGTDEWIDQADADLDDEVTGGCSVLVSSIGGSGTTSFLQELGKVKPSLGLNSVTDSDQMKHHPYSRLPGHKNLKKIVYLYGDATHAILSLNRRGYLSIQANKVHTSWPKGQRNPRSVLDFAKSEGDDFYQVDKHFHSFREQCEYPVAFVDITQKDAHMDALSEFLERPVAELRGKIRPWHVSNFVEESMISLKNYENHTEEEYTRALMKFENERVDEMLLMKDLQLMKETGDPLSTKYKDIPKWVMTALDAKFAAVKKEQKELGGFYIQHATCADEKK